MTRENIQYHLIVTIPSCKTPLYNSPDTRVVISSFHKSWLNWHVNDLFLYYIYFHFYIRVSLRGEHKVIEFIQNVIANSNWFSLPRLVLWAKKLNRNINKSNLGVMLQNTALISTQMSHLQHHFISTVFWNKLLNL